MNFISFEDFCSLTIQNEIDIENIAINYFNNEIEKLGRHNSSIKKHIVECVKGEDSYCTPKPIILDICTLSPRANIPRITRKLQYKLIKSGWFNENNGKCGVVAYGSKVVTPKSNHVRIGFKFVKEKDIKQIH